MFAKVRSVQPIHLSGEEISVEADLARGLHSFGIVGLPDKAVEESKDRVSAAIKNSGFPSPKSQNRKVTISLAPAHVRKEGPSFDLPIALAYLLASEEVAFNSSEVFFIGELSLDGTIRPVRGALPGTKRAKDAGGKIVVVPKENALEAALISDIIVIGAHTLREVIDHFTGKKVIAPTPPTTLTETTQSLGIDFRDVRGQESAKRGLEIAASGRHNIALFGPPGTGKTLLARAFQTILPPLSLEEALEVTAIHSVAGILDVPIVQHPPFRSPHHTASYVSIVGGGASLRPGEASLAHRGVLFLDEFPEFDRRSIDALREPLEERNISVSRAKGTVILPAHFILIAALNPTRIANASGYEALREKERLRKKISGPIIDRIDMWIEVPHIPHALLEGVGDGEESRVIRARVIGAREVQRERFGSPLRSNSDMQAHDISTRIKLSRDSERLLRESAETLHLSPRTYHRMVKLAQTIADLERAPMITEHHILEALQYRPKQLFE